MMPTNAPLSFAGNAAVILAAGRGARAAAPDSAPKQYRPLAGLPLFCHALRVFLGHGEIDRVLTVIGAGEEESYWEGVRHAGLESHGKLLAPVVGGAERQDSARAGVEALGEGGGKSSLDAQSSLDAKSPPRNVLLHDAARPLVTAGDISACLNGLRDAAAVIPVLSLTDALKSWDGTHLRHAPREEYRLALTPQGFDYAALLRAHRECAGEALPDDAALMEKIGVPIRAIPGRRDNIKITRPQDFQRAEALLSAAARPSDAPLVRVGCGFDAHPLAAGRKLRLCGVRIEHERGLTGHSDADVGLHALTDALLGALAAGDIGEHFPPSDARWRDADSRVFLSHAVEMARAEGFAVAHADVTLLCEAPRIAPHRRAMQEAVAAILELPPERVSIKASSTEGMGFVGRKEGIAAQAVVGLARREARG